MKIYIFMAFKINIMVLWVITLCSDVIGYQHFEGLCCLCLHSDTGILPHHYIVSLPRRPQHEARIVHLHIIKIVIFINSRFIVEYRRY